MSVQAIPPGFHTVTPYLLSQDAGKLLEFIVQAFGAEVLERMELPDGTVNHAQARVGDSVVMMGTAGGEHPAMPTMLYLYVEDCVAWYQSALAAGATSVQEPRNEFYGDRVAAVEDPLGNSWWIATHVEDLDSEEIARRAAKARS